MADEERTEIDLQRWIETQKKIVPDLLHVLGKRYRVIRMIESLQPIGRRSLAQTMHMSERTVRTEIEFLKREGLLSFTPGGMRLTEEGSRLHGEMEQMIRHLFGLVELEQTITRKLGLHKVIIIPGDSGQSPWLKHDLGREAVKELRRCVQKGWTVSITGGGTMAAVADAMTASAKFRSLMYVPARGGLGEILELQSNTIVSKMAEKTGGQYRLLHIPDQLSEEAYLSMRHDPQIEEVLEKVRAARVVIHGIGEAITMAKRRKAEPELLAMLEDKQAVSEAFGYYFDKNGQIIHKVRSIGLQLEDARQADHILAVAGGKEKADAILSFLRHGVHDVLITDEGAAREMERNLST